MKSPTTQSQIGAYTILSLLALMLMVWQCDLIYRTPKGMPLGGHVLFVLLSLAILAYVWYKAKSWSVLPLLTLAFGCISAIYYLFLRPF